MTIQRTDLCSQSPSPGGLHNNDGSFLTLTHSRCPARACLPVVAVTIPPPACRQQRRPLPDLLRDDLSIIASNEYVHVSVTECRASASMTSWQHIHQECCGRTINAALLHSLSPAAVAQGLH
ncbi:unnamed protein product [Arctogadus glacialis]